MADTPPDARDSATPGEYRPHETTVHYGPEFAAQLAALEAGVNTEEHEVIGALPSGSALLIVRRGPTAGARFLLDADVTVAGRHPEADIFLDDVTVSRKHAAFLRQGTQFAVRDLGSLNGTFMGGDRIADTVALVDGCEVQVGKFHLTFYASRIDLAAGA
ncbi:FHA domain-containing protein [Microcella sp.]|jgi:pSer/pThr/pTyr-binding forkhead associated (FHA) protein|uniref:FHA domain-containing protein n=1 Tax=Microcella sp. TaxID=1913979 RepID=UPI00391A792B